MKFEGLLKDEKQGIDASVPRRFKGLKSSQDTHKSNCIPTSVTVSEQPTETHSYPASMQEQLESHP